VQASVDEQQQRRREVEDGATAAERRAAAAEAAKGTADQQLAALKQLVFGASGAAAAVGADASMTVDQLAGSAAGASIGGGSDAAALAPLNPQLGAALLSLEGSSAGGAAVAGSGLLQRQRAQDAQLGELREELARVSLQAREAQRAREAEKERFEQLSSSVGALRGENNALKGQHTHMQRQMRRMAQLEADEVRHKRAGGGSA
jgi:hypothetical protein